jgi:hypothetical protein
MCTGRLLWTVPWLLWPLPKRYADAQSCSCFWRMLLDCSSLCFCLISGFKLFSRNLHCVPVIIDYVCRKPVSMIPFMSQKTISLTFSVHGSTQSLEVHQWRVTTLFSKLLDLRLDVMHSSPATCHSIPWQPSPSASYWSNKAQHMSSNICFFSCINWCCTHWTSTLMNSSSLITNPTLTPSITVRLSPVLCDFPTLGILPLQWTEVKTCYACLLAKYHCTPTYCL